MKTASRTRKTISSITVRLGAAGSNYCAWTQAYARSHAAAGYSTESGRAEPGSAVIVAVYNYAAVPKATLQKAEAETARIFDKTGVKIVWRHCLIVGKEVQCPQRDPSSAATDVALRILPGSMVRRLARGKGEGGFAVACPTLDSICQVDVFYDRAEELAQAGCAHLWKIMACIAAHELGHALLGTDSHSPVGIMRPQWGPADFREAAGGQLTFTPQQAERLRANLHKRIAQNGRQ